MTAGMGFSTPRVLKRNNIGEDESMTRINDHLHEFLNKINVINLSAVSVPELVVRFPVSSL